MHAIIRQGNGKYYVSAVFGYCRDIITTYNYGRKSEEPHEPYWIVWDAEKKRLIRTSTLVPNTKYLIRQILIVDTEKDNWNVDENGVGCVDFLSKELLDSILDEEIQPEEILGRCRNMDKDYVYPDITEVKTKQDIENLMWVSGGFHDARIAKEELQNDGTLYLRFDGIWGCEIEVWFSGDLKYSTSSRDPEDCDPYWFGATVILQDGYVYLVDEENMTVESITSDFCYFRAKHMKYKVIPD